MTWRTLWDRASDLLDCAVTELDANADSHQVAGAPAYRFVAPGGQIAFDNCCDCDHEEDDGCGGQLYVRVIKAHPVSPIPTKILREIPCPDTIGVHLAIGVIRCAASLDDDGNPPSAETLNAESAQMVCDMAALLRALECCDTDDERTTIDTWTPLGPAGGCAGGEWSFWWTPRLACPDEDESQ
jgi:hypothetical protein